VIAPHIPFNSLRPGEDQEAIAAAIHRVIERGWFVLGPEVEAFEHEWAEACGARHAVGVNTGTDAIALIFRALGIGAGAEVITTPLSAAYSALAIMMAGARPVFADIDEARLTIDPAAIEAAITPRTAAILPVHLYGQPADMGAVLDIASRHHLAVVEDACQAHLATCGGRAVSTLGVAGAFSFYPTKNLGALGDGGAIVTDDGALAARVRRLRNGGQSAPYRHVEFGVNSRLDEVQAAILRERLTFLPGWTDRRRGLADAYRKALAGAPVIVPDEIDPGHVYHLFPVRSAERDRVRQHLAADGIETLVHYPVPIPRQPALAAERPGACPVADRICSELVSLPLHPSLPVASLQAVAAALGRFQPGSLAVPPQG
jgi:dTDP-3-amino-3,4,6-trideoxy-alpha-D-glucose transaminase